MPRKSGGKAASGGGGKVGAKRHLTMVERRPRKQTLKSKPPSPKRAGESRRSGTPSHIRHLNLVYLMLENRNGVTFDEISRLQGYSDLFDVIEKNPKGAAAQRAKKSLRRRWERDRAELAGIGIEIESKAHLNEGNVLAYFLKNTSLFSKPIRLESEELALLDVVLRSFQSSDKHQIAETARQGLIKLKCRSDISVEERPSNTVAQRLTNSKAQSTLLDTLQAAFIKRQPVSFKYRSRDQVRATQRTLEIFGFVQRNGVFYAIGRETQKDAIRVFSLSRMQGTPTVLAKTEAKAYEIPKGFSLREVFSPEPFGASSAEAAREVVVRFDADVGFIFANAYEGQMMMTHRKDGALTVRFPSAYPSELFRVLAEYSGHFEILKPVSVRREIAQRLRDTLGVYR